MSSEIVIHGARLHNLKNITVRIPKNSLVVITGLSGSGKSALAIDTLCREGQRQYLEALGVIAYQLPRSAVDRIEGLSPTIAVGQQVTNRSPRSTVGTETGIYAFLRLLFAKVGHRPCPACGGEILSPYLLDEQVADDLGGPETGATFPCPHCGARVEALTMAHFSFNKLAGACPACSGLGVISEIDPSQLLDETKSVVGGAVYGWNREFIAYQVNVLRRAAAHYGFPFDPDQPIRDYGVMQRDLLLYGVASPRFRRRFPAIQPPATARSGRFEGVVTSFMRRYAERINDEKYREKMERLMRSETCPDCGGLRLRAESRAVTVAGRTIVELAHMSLIDLGKWSETCLAALDPTERTVARPILDEIHKLLGQVINIGLGYLALDRSSPSLSAGEAQRLRLAALIGSGLSGITYVLDEPTLGLHQRDTTFFVDVLRRLRDTGNTVVVIEHDLEFIRAADYVIDMGPGAGRGGGTVVAAGTPAEVARVPESATGRFLSGVESVPAPLARRTGGGLPRLVIRGARARNLKNITVGLPLGKLVAVTGVSGSGKSTLLFDIVAPAARRHFGRLSRLQPKPGQQSEGEVRDLGDPPGEHDTIEGWEHLDRVLAVDQESVAHTPRSNVATYTGAFDGVRKVYASLPLSRDRGLDERHFSLNVVGGRCEKCQGAGVVEVPMQLLPAAAVRCPACRGRRFKQAILEARYRGHSIDEVLDMTVEEAAQVFCDVKPVYDRFSLMAECGLGYLKLGQPITTLSGGEAQRVKLTRELGRHPAGRSLTAAARPLRTLYLLDEPSRGLHAADIAKLVRVLQGLVEAGNTVIVIEHNLDVVKCADWVVDLGPEGGEAGGRLVAEGAPEEVAMVESSHTGRFLRRMLGVNI